MERRRADYSAPVLELLPLIGRPFQDRASGQPSSSHALGERLWLHGVTKQARISALHDLTRKIPSIILADLIGYNCFGVANRANVLGSPWKRYAKLAAKRTTGS